MVRSPSPRRRPAAVTGPGGERLARHARRQGRAVGRVDQQERAGAARVGVRVERQRLGGAHVTRPMSLATSCPGCGCGTGRRGSSRDGISLTIALTVRVVCLSSTRSPDPQRPVGDVADGRLDVLRGGGRGPRSARSGRRARRRCRRRAAPSPTAAPRPRPRCSPSASMPVTVRVRPDGSTMTSSPTRSTPGGDLARVAAVVGVLGGPRADHVLHREAARAARSGRA